MSMQELNQLIEALDIPEHKRRYFLNDYNSFVNYFGESETFRILSSGEIVDVITPNLPHPIWIRPVSSDIPTFRQVFIDEHYRAELDFEPKTIVDAGSNIGLASLYFLGRYPNARIISIEPEANNYNLLLFNTKPYGSLEALNKALWYKNGADLTIINPDSDAWGFQVGEIEDGQQLVRTISMPAILQRVASIDLLKMDIEGAEKALFEHEPYECLPFVSSIFIEIHDNIVPGSSDLILTTLGQAGFRLAQTGHVQVFIRE